MSENDPKEIVSELREYAERYSDPTDELMRDAADTIEAMENKLRSSILDTLAVTDTNAEIAARLSASQARLSEAVKVLEPFARYLDEYRFDIDNNGNPLPDETHPGWTYLTAGDFRAAKAFLATLGEEE